MVSITTKAIAGLVAFGALFLIIRGAGQRLDNLTNPLAGVQAPSLPNISLPEINLPSINFPDIFGGGGPAAAVPDPVVVGPIRENVDSTLLPTPEEREAGNRSILERLGLSPDTPTPIIDTPTSLNDFVNRFTGSGLTEAEQFAAEQRGRDISVPSPFNDQTFQGGGPSFEGGQIFETPIENLSLSQIIERFGVGASEAADIRARARNDFGDFDFGSNTGSGIGSVTQNPDINTALPNTGAISNPEFEGLSAEEIALRLTGGNISNF